MPDTDNQDPLDIPTMLLMAGEAERRIAELEPYETHSFARVVLASCLVSKTATLASSVRRLVSEVERLQSRPTGTLVVETTDKKLACKLIDLLDKWPGFEADSTTMHVY